jgi:phosphatidylglycerol---prolipoprotein diacylglyceryl transferase
VRPVLFSVFGFDIQSYGVSKALAALVAAFLLARAFERVALNRDSAYSLVMWATIWGRRRQDLPSARTAAEFDVHNLGGMGFTWYGGLIGGVMDALFIVHRHQLPLGILAGAAAVTLTICLRHRQARLPGLR